MQSQWLRSLSRFSAPQTGDRGQAHDGDADNEDHVTVEPVWVCVTITGFFRCGAEDNFVCKTGRKVNY